MCIRDRSDWYDQTPSRSDVHCDHHGMYRKFDGDFYYDSRRKNVHKLMDLSINKNWIDKEEYPQSAAIDLRCVNMVADLWLSLIHI